MKKIISTLILLPLAGFMMILSSCAVLTESTEGTTETLENTTDASTDFTSSTSGRDEDESRAQKIKAFTTVNMDRLREDMARGGGEHLASLAYLLGVGKEHRDDFFTLTQGGISRTCSAPNRRPRRFCLPGSTGS